MSMATPTVQRALGSIPRGDAFLSMSDQIQFQTLVHLLRVLVSVAFLPLDNTILVVVYLANYAGVLSSPAKALRRRRQALQDVHFYPKTILVSGVNTPHGLAVARSWYLHGHRVVGADVVTDDRPTPTPPSGESMSTALTVCYRIPQSQYVSRLLDIVQREKVDLWVPCSSETSAGDDAIAKEVLESRTPCKCIHLDPELARRFSNPDLFAQFLAEKDLPIVERHQVQSRDSIHRILHRSPSKVFRLRKSAAGSGTVRSDGNDGGDPLILPKRTLSLTYSQVSEVPISKDNPWVLQQQTRLGEFRAELLVVRGQVKAIRVLRSGGDIHGQGPSRLDGGLATAIHKLMDQLATKGGPRMTTHLTVQLHVDEQFEANSVRYVVHIAGCTLGAFAVAHLLQDGSSTSLVTGYLSLLSPCTTTSLCREGGERSQDGKAPEQRQQDEEEEEEVATIYTEKTRRFSLYQMVRSYDVRRILPALYPACEHLDDWVHREADRLLFWNSWRFSPFDPLPWWWHVHVQQPLEEVGSLLGGRESVKTK